MDTLTPELKKELGDLDAEKQQALGKVTALGQEDVKREEAKTAEMAPAQKAYDQALSAPMPTKATLQPAAPVDEAKTHMDPKEYESLSYGLIAMALIGGAVSHGNWLGASSALNGAMQGIVDGNHEKAKTEYERYQRDFKAAQEREAQADREYQDALGNRKLTINEQLAKLQSIASKYQQEDVLSATKTKSLQNTINQIESRRTQLLGVEQRHDAVASRITVQLNGQSERAARGKFTPEGSAFAAEYSRITGTPVSLYGGKAQIFNMLAAQGVDPAEMAANKGEFAAINTALRQQVSREAGIENITQQIQALEPDVIRLAKKVGLSESSLVNTPMNYLKSKLGSADLAQLKAELVAVSREYIRATTAPQSQGQLHVASQEMGEELLNSQMGVGQIIGSFRGINTDVATGRAAASNIAKTLRDRIVSKHKMVNEDANAPAAAPANAPAGGPVMSLDDYIKSKKAK